MKKTILLLAISAAIAVNSYATVRNVSNDPASGSTNAPYFYTTLQAAYTDASAGDTLMLEGTNVAYTVSNSVNWSKQLVVIGIGFNPTKSSPRQTLITGLGNSTITLTTAGNGSKFYGIRFLQTLGINGGISNYSFEDCLFDNNINFSGQSNVNTISFKNCVFALQNGVNYYCGTTSNPYSNVIFSSCIFNGYIDGQGNITSGITVDHCLFLHFSNSLGNLQNSIIKNSIFMNFANITTSNSINNTFTNNISRLATVYPPTGNTGSGNLNIPFPYTDTLFVKYTAGSLYSSTHNYHLRTSPVTIAAGAATDGTDIGLHGGLSNFNETGEVLINPIIETLNINNTTVVPNGTLNVQIKARKPGDN